MTTETILPELVGVLANLPHHTQAVIRAYGAACARTALQSPEVQRLREDMEIVAWRYRTPTGWHATTDAARALAIKDHHDVEPLFAKRAAPVTKES